MLTLLTVMICAAPPTDHGEDARGLGTRVADDIEQAARQHNADREAFGDALVQLLEEHGDLERFAEASLGRHWSKLTPPQQRLFTDRVADLLRTLVRRYAGGWPPVSLSRAIARSGPRQTSLVRFGLTMPAHSSAEEESAETHVVELVVVPTPRGPRVLDVRVDEISLLRTYRSGFVRTLRRSAFDTLIVRLDSTIRRVRSREARGY